MRAFLPWIGLGVAVLCLAPLVALTLQDRLHPPPPAPLELKILGPQEADYAASKTPVVLASSGISVTLPAGTRIYPKALKSQPGLVRLKAELRPVSFWATFYDQGAEPLAAQFRAIQANPTEQFPRENLLGTSRLLEVQGLPGSEGEVLVFELQLESGKRETVLVAIPNRGGSLATLTAHYAFDPGASRLLREVARGIRFQTPAGSES